MAQPKLAIQAGRNKSGLDQADKDTAKDSEIKEYEQEFGLDEDTAEQEVIELDDGSVVINLKETKGPQEDPDFYANMAEYIDQSVLDKLASDYLDLIDVDQESRKQRDKQYEE